MARRDEVPGDDDKPASRGVGPAAPADPKQRKDRVRDGEGKQPDPVDPAGLGEEKKSRKEQR